MHRFQHGYLPQSRDEANDWQPHEWVVVAIQAAALPSTTAAPGIDLATLIVDHLCEQEYDIGGRDELLRHVREAIDASPKG